MPAVTPGTTSKAMPAARSASASSPPRPNTNGSPPFNRTTLRPLAPYSSSSRSVSSCGTCGPPPTLPTSTISASGRAPSSAPGGIRRSWRITSAAAISSPRAHRHQPGIARAGTDEEDGHAQRLGVAQQVGRAGREHAASQRLAGRGLVDEPDRTVREACVAAHARAVGEHADRRVAARAEHVDGGALLAQRRVRVRRGRRPVRSRPPPSPRVPAPRSRPAPERG